MLSRLALAALACIAVMTAAGCPSEIQSGMAVSGPKKYKADIMSSITTITGEMDSGQVNSGSIKKLESQLKHWEKEMGNKGTYMMAKEGLALLKDAQADPSKTFKLNQEAKMKFLQALDYFKTEVPD